MPSKEELCFLSEAKTATTQDFLSRDIDDLVLEIKENLRLKSRPAQLNGGKAKTRASPYSVPSRTESKCGCCEGRRCIRRGLATRRSSDDPYEALQELLKDGDLIKEAVRRLQLGLSPKQRVYYDSDDELRTPPYPFDHIEVWLSLVTSCSPSPQPLDPSVMPWNLSPHPPLTAVSTSHRALGQLSAIPTTYESFGQHKISRGRSDIRLPGRLGFYQKQ